MVQGGQALLGGDFRAPAPRRGYKVRLSSLARQPKVESLPAGRLRMWEIDGGGGEGGGGRGGLFLLLMMVVVVAVFVSEPRGR